MEESYESKGNKGGRRIKERGRRFVGDNEGIKLDLSTEIKFTCRMNRVKMSE